MSEMCQGCGFTGGTEQEHTAFAHKQIQALLVKFGKEIKDRNLIIGRLRGIIAAQHKTQKILDLSVTVGRLERQLDEAHAKIESFKASAH